MPEEENQVIVLVDEEDKEHEFVLLATLDVDGSNYVLLLPLDELGEDDGVSEAQEAIIMRVDTTDDGEQVLCEIEDDAEWETVAEAWEESLEEK